MKLDIFLFHNRAEHLPVVQSECANPRQLTVIYVTHWCNTVTQLWASVYVCTGVNIGHEYRKKLY